MKDYILFWLAKGVSNLLQFGALFVVLGIAAFIYVEVQDWKAKRNRRNKNREER
jgi:hypothetical protein